MGSGSSTNRMSIVATRRFAASNAFANSGSLVSASLDPALLCVALTGPVSCLTIRKAKVAVKLVPLSRRWFCRRCRRRLVRPNIEVALTV